MTRAELVAKYERLATDTPVSWLAEIYTAVMIDLRTLESEGARISYNSGEAARACGVTPKTIAHWCELGRFPNAFKTSPGKGGQWVVPAGDVDAYLTQKARRVA